MKNVTIFYTIKNHLCREGKGIDYRLSSTILSTPIFWDRNSSLEEKDTMLRGGGRRHWLSILSTNSWVHEQRSYHNHQHEERGISWYNNWNFHTTKIAKMTRAAKCDVSTTVMLPQNMLPQKMMPQNMLPQNMLPNAKVLLGSDRKGWRLMC